MCTGGAPSRSRGDVSVGTFLWGTFPRRRSRGYVPAETFPRIRSRGYVPADTFPRIRSRGDVPAATRLWGRRVGNAGRSAAEETGHDVDGQAEDDGAD